MKIKLLLISLIFVGCASNEYGHSKTDCLVEMSALKTGTSKAHEILYEPESKYLEKFVLSRDYGDSCGFWFYPEVKSEYSETIIAGPTEIVLLKESWEYVTTNYYSHEIW